MTFVSTRDLIARAILAGGEADDSMTPPVQEVTE